MSYAQARELDAGLIPIIDITPLRDGSNATDVAKALHAASQSLGFIYVSGHGIAETLITEARDEAFRFFRSSSEAKQHVTINKQHRGWLGQNAAKMGDDQKPDLKESFVWGYEDDYGNAPQDHPLQGLNQWPETQPNLRKVATRYFQATHNVAHHLMRGFALGLDLEPDFFLRTATPPLSRASFVYYPEQPETLGQDQFGVGPHTDFGVLTVLCQDDVGGLQVQDQTGDWVHASPIPGTLVINVGDLLSRWTRGAYKSTPHRVVNTSGRERLSLVLAFDPNPETMIDPSDIYGDQTDDDAQAITCGDYLLWRFEKAFSYRKG